MTMFDMNFWIGIATAVLFERTLDLLGYGLHRMGYKQCLRDIEPLLRRMEDSMRNAKDASDSIQRILNLPFANAAKDGKTQNKTGE